MQRKQQVALIGIGMLMYQVVLQMLLLFNVQLPGLQRIFNPFELTRQEHAMILLIVLFFILILIIIAFPLKLPSRHLRQWYE